jgi:hypothetical protein
MTTETTIATPAVAAKAPKAPRVTKTKAVKATKQAKAPKAKTPAKAKAKAKNAGKVTAPKAERSADWKRIKRIGDKEHKVDLSRYHTVVSAKGNSSLDNGDDVASSLRGKTIDEVYAIVSRAVEIPQTQLRALYSHLNVGMQRMNLGNKLRGALAVEE